MSSRRLKLLAVVDDNECKHLTPSYHQSKSSVQWDIAEYFLSIFLFFYGGKINIQVKPFELVADHK